MKLATTLLLPALVHYAAAASVFGGNQQQVLEAGLAVPGDNPLTYCAADNQYSLKIDKVDLTPNPPKKGAQLTINAEGEFTKEVGEGSYINVEVKYGLIKLISLQFDLCKEMAEVDEKCPLKGHKTFTKDVNIPDLVPPGSYTALADVYDENKEHITCLQAAISF